SLRNSIKFFEKSTSSSTTNTFSAILNYPCFLLAESMFTSNDDAISAEIQHAEILFKDIHAKGMDSIKIISIDKNLIRTISASF
ncbi:MAG: hypothetical protein PVH27_11335, partial [Desulfobacterales bacterium]